MSDGPTIQPIPPEARRLLVEMYLFDARLEILGRQYRFERPDPGVGATLYYPNGRGVKLDWRTVYFDFTNVMRPAALPRQVGDLFGIPSYVTTWKLDDRAIERYILSDWTREPSGYARTMLMQDKGRCYSIPRGPLEPWNAYTWAEVNILTALLTLEEARAQYDLSVPPLPIITQTRIEIWCVGWELEAGGEWLRARKGFKSEEAARDYLRKVTER